MYFYIIPLLIASAISTLGASVNSTITFSDNKCGYETIQYNNSLSQFDINDNVYFYNDETVLSNCGAQNTTIGCTHLVHMTGPFSVFGYTPYTIWYYPYPVNDSYVMNIFYKYDTNNAVMVGTVPCDSQGYTLGLSNCAFNQQIFSYQFYKYYLFNFYANCTYNSTANTINFSLDEAVDTCVGFDAHQQCITNHNSINIVTFQDWTPTPFNYTYDTSDYGVYPPYTAPLPTVTETVTANVTTNVTETVTANVTETITGGNVTVTETATGSNATITITDTTGSNITVTVTDTNSATATITETITNNITVTATATSTDTTTTTTDNSTMTTADTATPIIG